MKINIVYTFKDSAYGGANQFLKALKIYFENHNIYTDNIEEADVLLFNSHNEFDKLLFLKKQYPQKIFIHRMDGSCRLYNNPHDKRDLLAYTLNDMIADATVFQSQYSMKVSVSMGIPRQKYERVILNTSDAAIFNSSGKRKTLDRLKIKLIATSFSKNWNKGFEVYQYLDENLDFSRYKMVFIGNSPIEFKNIELISPLPSDRLALELKKSDIYITASKKEACSNSLIEALSCGLPVVAYKDGGNLELVKEAGECFEHKEEIPYLLKKIACNYDDYVSKIDVKEMEQIGKEYSELTESIMNDVTRNDYRPKTITNVDIIKANMIQRWCECVTKFLLMRK